MLKSKTSNTTSSSPTKDSNESTISKLQQYRSHTMKQYGLMVEYKHLKQYAPSGVYVLPSLDDNLTWYGVIFVRRSLYANGIFKFRIQFPEDYNSNGSYPLVRFNTKVFHPYVDPITNELDLKPRFSEWKYDLHYVALVLNYLKSIFYMKTFPEGLKTCANLQALELYNKNNKEEYLRNVELCVQGSMEKVYDNDVESSIKFSKPIPAHDRFRISFQAEKNQANNGNVDFLSVIHAASNA